MHATTLGVGFQVGWTPPRHSAGCHHLLTTATTTDACCPACCYHAAALPCRFLPHLLHLQHLLATFFPHLLLGYTASMLRLYHSPASPTATATTSVPMPPSALACTLPPPPLLILPLLSSPPPCYPATLPIPPPTYPASSLEVGGGEVECGVSSDEEAGGVGGWVGQGDGGQMVGGSGCWERR